MDVAHGEMVEAELDRLLEKRVAREDPDAKEELWVRSVEQYDRRRDEEMRAGWCEHHQGQAARLRSTLKALIARHEEQAEKYRDQPEGSA